MVGCSHLDQYKGQNRCVHSMVQPPWDKVVKQSWVYHLSVIGIDGPEHRNNKNPDREGQHGQRPVPERDELPELSFLLLVPAASGQKTREVSQHTDAEEHGLDNLIELGKYLSEGKRHSHIGSGKSVEVLYMVPHLSTE